MAIKICLCRQRRRCNRDYMNDKYHVSEKNKGDEIVKGGGVNA